MNISDNTAVKAKVTKTFTGLVVKMAMEKTVTVLVERRQAHPKYGKYVKVSRKFLVHQPADFQCKVGDFVEIEECRPMSKNKAFVLTRVIRESVAD